MKPLHTCLLALAVAASALPTSVSAQWKWRDANGKVQYSDRPPPTHVPDSAVLKRPTGSERAPDATGAAPAASAAPAAPAAASAASAPAASASAPALDKGLEARRRAEEQAQAAQRKAQEQKAAKEKAENCTRALAQLRTLEGGGRITRTNAKGEREFLDDATRAREAAQIRQGVATHCK